jgi:hypothetical protein
MEKFFGLGTPELCSLGCMKDYTLSMPWTGPGNARFGVFGLELGECGYGQCYSALVDWFFRSEFEAKFAEVLRWDWKLRDAMYEAYAIKLPGDGKRYIPDFFIEDHGVWFEVKGRWHSGDKKKFLEASKVVGPERLILVSPFYYREVKRVRIV